MTYNLYRRMCALSMHGGEQIHLGSASLKQCQHVHVTCTCCCCSEPRLGQSSGWPCSWLMTCKTNSHSHLYCCNENVWHPTYVGQCGSADNEGRVDEDRLQVHRPSTRACKLHVCCEWFTCWFGGLCVGRHLSLPACRCTSATCCVCAHCLELLRGKRVKPCWTYICCV